jgi:hypothetical protein
MGGLEDDGVIDEEERLDIDEAWRKARRTKLVSEAGWKEVDRRTISVREGKFLGREDSRKEKSEELCSRELSYVCDFPLRLIGS